MKTVFTTSLKDLIAAAAILTATFVAIIGSLVTSSDVLAERASQPALRRIVIQKMDTIAVTAPRFYRIVTLETVVVTASRRADDATKIVAAPSVPRS